MEANDVWYTAVLPVTKRESVLIYSSEGSVEGSSEDSDSSFHVVLR